MLLADVFVPQPGSRTLDDLRRVMADCAAGSSDGRHSRQVDAKASATTPPPTADEVFFTQVAELMDAEGLSRAEAIRRISIEKPDLRRAWVGTAQRERSEAEAKSRKFDARAVARRNAR